MTDEPSSHEPHGWLARLARQLSVAPVPADVAERISELRASLSAFLNEQAANREAIDGLRDAVDRLERQQSRAGKEQFKANVLTETQQRSIQAMLDQLQEADACRQREVAQLRERLAGARDEGRLDLVRRLLPVLDGLGEALSSGERLLRRVKKAPALSMPSPAPPSPPSSRRPFLQRLSAAAKLLFAEADAPDRPAPAEAVGTEDLAAWLQGLTFVQDRLLEVLAAEGVYPIVTDEESFDPLLHVAVEAVPAEAGVAPGTIVSEARRGYVRGDTVLRYAEVVVAR